jgi:hypothetical protein
MGSGEFRKRDIALAQLETALELYLDGKDRFSVITLAGAAEELLGKELVAQGNPNALSIAQALTAVVGRALDGREIKPKAVADIANRARNEAKHLDEAGPRSVMMDPEVEAQDVLDRAVTNYWRLTQDQTPAMTRFLKSRYD